MKQKHYIIIILLLVVLNVFSWRMWWERPKVENRIKQGVEHFRGDNNREEKGLRFLIGKLNLSEEQKQQFKDLRHSHFKQMKKKDAQLDSLKKDLMQSIAAGDELNLKKGIDEMAEIKSSIESEMIYHFASMRKICTPEQQKDFDILFKKMLFHNNKGFKRGGPSGKEGKGREQMRHKQSQN